MTQQSFDFTPQPNESDTEIRKWVEHHNQQVIVASQNVNVSPGSLLSALGSGEARANAVYLLRTVLGQHLRKSMVPGIVPFKRGFLQALRGEMTIKKTSQDPTYTIRNILIKMHALR